MILLPLSHTDIRQKILPTKFSQLILSQLLAMGFVETPDIHQCHKIGLLMLKLFMFFVSCLLLVMGPVSRILHGQGANDS